MNAPSTTFDLKHRSRALTEGPERAAARAYLHGIVSIHVFATPMIGLARSSSPKPMPFR